MVRNMRIEAITKLQPKVRIIALTDAPVESLYMLMTIKNKPSVAQERARFWRAVPPTVKLSGAYHTP